MAASSTPEAAAMTIQICRRSSPERNSATTPATAPSARCNKTFAMVNKESLGNAASSALLTARTPIVTRQIIERFRVTVKLFQSTFGGKRPNQSQRRTCQVITHVSGVTRVVREMLRGLVRIGAHAV